jgi:hypothetical protein
MEIPGQISAEIDIYSQPSRSIPPRWRRRRLARWARCSRRDCQRRDAGLAELINNGGEALLFLFQTRPTPSLMAFSALAGTGQRASTDFLAAWGASAALPLDGVWARRWRRSSALPVAAETSFPRKRGSRRPSNVSRSCQRPPSKPSASPACPRKSLRRWPQTGIASAFPARHALKTAHFDAPSLRRPPNLLLPRQPNCRVSPMP